jgi:hypothetical protein
MIEYYDAPPSACEADRLSRYEATLWRQVRQVLLALDALDRRKPQERRRRLFVSNQQGQPACERDEF